MGPSGPLPIALCGYLTPLGNTGPMLAPSGTACRTRYLRRSLELAVRRFGSTSSLSASGLDQGDARSVSLILVEATMLMFVPDWWKMSPIFAALFC